MKNVIILRGLPGAGKSSLSDLLSGGNQDIVCEADQFQLNSKGEYEFKRERLHYAHGKCFDKFKALVDKGEETIILSNTSTKRKEFIQYYKYAYDNDYRVTVTVVENYHGNKSIHDVPEEAMDAMRERFQINLG